VVILPDGPLLAFYSTYKTSLSHILIACLLSASINLMMQTNLSASHNRLPLTLSFCRLLKVRLKDARAWLRRRMNAHIQLFF
jgi:hypothetical protein